MLTIPAIKEMQIKDSTLPLLEWLPSRTQTTTNAGKEVEKKELSYTADGNVK
jgi:hypothetical protein